MPSVFILLTGIALLFSVGSLIPWEHNNYLIKIAVLLLAIAMLTSVAPK